MKDNFMNKKLVYIFIHQIYETKNIEHNNIIVFAFILRELKKFKQYFISFYLYLILLV